MSWQPLVWPAIYDTSIRVAALHRECGVAVCLCGAIAWPGARSVRNAHQQTSSQPATFRYSNSGVRPAAHSCPAVANCLPSSGVWESAAPCGTSPTCLNTVPSHIHPCCMQAQGTCSFCLPGRRTSHDMAPRGSLCRCSIGVRYGILHASSAATGLLEEYTSRYGTVCAKRERLLSLKASSIRACAQVDSSGRTRNQAVRKPQTEQCNARCNVRVNTVSGFQLLPYL